MIEWGVFPKSKGDMFVLGLTGGIGTGKSQVGEILAGLGASIINADNLGHKVYEPDTDGWAEVVKAFGEDVLSPSREVDRKKLGGVVFSDPRALERLNAIMHPRIYALIADEIERLKKAGREQVVVEAALLIEAGWSPLVDEIWVTTSPERLVVERLQKRNGLSEEAIRARIASQMPQEERVKHAAEVIENSSTLSELKIRVQQLWEHRAKPVKESKL